MKNQKFDPLTKQSPSLLLQEYYINELEKRKSKKIQMYGLKIGEFRISNNINLTKILLYFKHWKIILK